MVNQVSVWDAVIAAPFGRLGVRTEMVDGSLMVSQLVYLDHDQALKSPKTALAKELEKQFKCYFKNPQFIFDLPLKPFGTTFQQRVWAEIEKISCGEVKTYGALAQSLKSAPRAVGQACGSNPYPFCAVSSSGVSHRHWGLCPSSGRGVSSEC